ncbi:hypothetical protein K437DRAFT_192865 [Tilletiaria anomala UBC 951]|uniref:Methyltransferase domain-containing protein n=1 Tax=Tilletiaria anomala (strain ATCC 24038 / CBS 436.72 / UBC 951) TaxID=1037660 RepID=A0A066VE50_TILAU|nr:uncharacterized protein K437DRAFT_192865 [Tilletiaria anomala UBC 951]KDN40022.1 hypothetical protein K437DRAFT_192865 [Tilletiaria anomala UBC 951]
MSGRALTLYYEEPPLPFKPATRALFEFTSPTRFPLSLFDEELAKHVKKCRDDVYARVSYPCLGLYRFLEPGSRENPVYTQAIECIKQQPDTRRILDMGCGYAQDIRAWIQDGVPSTSIVGADLLLDFVEDSFELFADEKGKDHMYGVKFEHCDIFDEDHVNKVKELSHGGQGFDVIYIGSFLHLFEWSEFARESESIMRWKIQAADVQGRVFRAYTRADAQAQVARALSNLLSNAPGSLIFGRQSGMPPGQAGHYERHHRTGAMGGNSQAPWRHDPDSFIRLWQDEARGRQQLQGSGGWEVKPVLPNPAFNWAGFKDKDVQELSRKDLVQAFGTGLEFQIIRK